MKKEYNIAGFGGQGIMFLGQVLAYTAMFAGKEATWIPSYGPEMRGGTANCMVVVADATVRSPLVEAPDIAIIFNKPSLEKYAPAIKPGGVALLVADQIDTRPQRDNFTVYAIPAKALAEAISAPLAALMAVDDTVDCSYVEAAVRKITPAHLAQSIDLNLRAVEAGYRHCAALIAGNPRKREG